MKRRKWVRLGAYALVLAALLAFYLLYNKDAEDYTEETTEEQELTLIEKGGEELEMIRLENSNGRLTFMLSRAEAEGDESEWRLEEMPGLTLDSGAVSGLAGSFSALKAENKLEAAEELSAYGLSPGMVTGTGFYSDGSQARLTLGSQTPDNKYYYALLNDSADIYLISRTVGERFFYGPDDVMDTALPDVTSEELRFLHVSAGGRRDIEVSKIENELIMASPFNGRPVWANTLDENIISAAEGLTLSGLVKYDAPSLEEYGLDQPVMEIILEGEENLLHLLIGSEIDESLSYCMEAQGSHVYSIENSLLKPFYEIEPFSIIDTFVNLMYKDNVDAIYINSPGQSYEIQLNRELVPVEKAEGDEGQSEEEELFDEVLSPEVNGIAVEERVFTSFYTKLISLSFDSEIEARPVSEYPEPEVTIEYVTIDGGSAISRFYEYNQDFYAVQTGGGDPAFAVSKRSVELMLKHEMLLAL